MTPSPDPRLRPWTGAPLLALLLCAGLSTACERADAGQGTGPAWSALVLGPARGELEPCGCAGGQLGGIDRVASILSTGAATPGAPVLRLAAGGVVAPEALVQRDWALAQLGTLWGAYGQLGFAAVGLGSSELALGVETLRGWSALLGPSPLLASNVVDGEGTFAFEPVHSDPATGARILSFARAPEGSAGEGWRVLPPGEALALLEPRGLLAPGGPTTLVLLEGGPQEAAALAPALPAGSLVLMWGERDEADDTPAPLPGGAVRAGHLGGRGRVLIELQPDPGPELGWRALAVTPAVPTSPAFATFREQYRQTLESTDVIGQLADRHGAPPRGGYAGSEACIECHLDAYEIWTETLHSRAALTLEEDLRGSANALADPDCVTCHTVGFGWRGGYASAELEETLRRPLEGGLAGVGCENCHGPGAAHCRSKAPEDVERASGGTCLLCHDGENDPYFAFTQKWPQIAHGMLDPTEGDGQDAGEPPARR